MNVSANNDSTASQIMARLEVIFKHHKPEKPEKPESSHITPYLRSESGAIDSVAAVVQRNLQSESIGLRQGSKNAESALSLTQVAKDATTEIDKNLVKMQALAAEFDDGVTPERSAELQSQYKTIAQDIDSISKSTTYNSINLLDGTISGEHDGTGQASTGALRIHVGTGNDAAQDYYDIDIGDMSTKALELSDTLSETSSDELEKARSSVDGVSKSLSFTQDRLKGTKKSNDIQADNFDAAALRISDAGTTDKTKSMSVESFFMETTDLLFSNVSVTDETKKQLMQYIAVQSSLFVMSEAKLLPETPMQLVSNRL